MMDTTIEPGDVFQFRRSADYFTVSQVSDGKVHVVITVMECEKADRGRKEKGVFNVDVFQQQLREHRLIRCEAPFL